ncbi:hypothetical protein FRB90_003454 [Tulasnella sp. 427]|nr:hypothetical protein FRB90_003454 [Tulasnella sp. 427]
MDLPPLPPLPSLFDSLGQNTSLLDFTSGFHIPALEDRPQDPIIARLSSDRQKGQGNSNCVFSTVSTQDVVSNGITNQSQSSTTSRDWTQHLPLDSPLRLLAWDQSNISMKPVVEAPASLSKQTFLSQKLTTTQARPRTIVMNADAIKDFFQYLVYGTSSQIFYWVDECELFKLNPKILGLCLEGLSNRSTDLIMTRFLNIGSLLRRLEEFVLGHSSRKSRVPEIHSLVHCVSVVIAHLRRTTTKQLLSSRALVANCLQYGETESILDFLGQVCYRNLDIFPPYQSLPQSQKELLDHVYLHSAHVVHSSPLRPLKAVAAYLLTETTYGWLGSVTAALGMEGQDLGKREIAGESTPVYDLWPSFVDERSGLLIQRGIKSLQLLRSGRPSHPACTARKTNTNAPKLRWVWTQDDVQDYITSQSSRLDHLKRLVLNEQLDGNALSQTAVRNRGAFPCIHVSLIHNVHPESQSVPSSYPPTIGDMVTFDRPPTLYDDHRSKSQAVKTLETMMESFPHTLPPVTPSMDRLGNLLIVEPLVAYSRLLSKSLLDVFLNELYLLVHLDVLHRFMLFGDANFVARLRFALCDERPFSDQSTDSSKDDNPTAAQSLGLGLNVRLSPTGDWPPSGFGLSHSLRSIIVEVLKASGTANSDMPGRESVIKEAEWRMGFVVPPADDDDEKARCHPFVP